MKLVKYLSTITLAAAVALNFAGCGSGPSNDQGVSFTLLGFFSELPDSGSEELPTGQLGKSVPLSAENPEQQTDNLVGTVSTVAGLQNNISTQVVRANRMSMNYYIEGASLQPPDTTIAVSLTLGPSTGTSSGTTEGEGSEGANTDNGTGSSLPDFGNIPNIAFGSFPIVPPEIIAWLNLNRGSLPELPFTMTITAKASAITSAGHSIESNTATFFVVFTPDIPIAPTEGTGTDTTEETL